MSDRAGTTARAGAWIGAAALVVLATHVLVYALAPHPSLIGTKLEYQAGGPKLLVLTLIALALAGVLAAAVVGVASVAVSERARLEPGTPTIRRISVVRLGVQAVALWCVTCGAFALVESYLHWRAGLGWHGLHCLVGPMHRDALPILAALSLVAAALVAVFTLLLSWARRVVAALRARPARLREATAARHRAAHTPPPSSPERWTGNPRAPPLSSSICPRRSARAVGQLDTRRSADMTRSRARKGSVALAASTVFALILCAGAWAHAEVSPAVAKAKTLQLFTLAVPTEEEGATTTTIELTPPAGFGIDSFAPSPGWKRTVQATGSGEDAVIQKVTWTGGSVPTEEDSVFQFLASPSSSKTYTFGVRQTYSNGKVVDWNGPESSDTPSPTIEAKSSIGGGNSPILSIVALVVGALGLLVGGFALAGGKRQLA